MYNNKLVPIFIKILDKYNIPESFDNLSQISIKVNNIKDTMHENISCSLNNIVKLESIELKTEELEQNSGIFKNNTIKLKNKLWWKNMQIWILIISIIVVILIIIISVCISTNKHK